MIIKSRVTGQFVLEVLENFSVDRSLPKHYVPPSQNEYEGFGMKRAFSVGVPFTSEGSDWSGVSLGKIRRRIAEWIFRAPGTRPVRNEPPSGKVDPIEVFGMVRDSVQKIIDYHTRVDKLELAILTAKQAGQTARVEALTKATTLVKYESILLANGTATFLTEAALIQFASLCKKGLSLTWVSNYGNPIPQDVVDKKVAADKLKVFDNYAILHWDPKKEAFSLTERERDAKRDLILFGLIQDSRKLYFVADWKDATDDLDMAEVSRVLGRQPDTIAADPTVA